MDDDDPQGEINIAVKLKDNSVIWPVRKCMNRLNNGREENIYEFVCTVTGMLKTYSVEEMKKLQEEKQDK